MHHIPTERWLSFSGLYIVIPQKIELFMDCNVLKMITITLIIQIHNTEQKFISKAIYISYIPAYVLPIHNFEKTGNHWLLS